MKCRAAMNQYAGQERAIQSPVLNLVKFAVLWGRTTTYTQQRSPMEAEISEIHLTQPHPKPHSSLLPPELTLLAGSLQDDLSRGREVHH